MRTMRTILFIIFASLISGCVAWNRGLEPTHPKYGYKSTSEYVNSLNPRLEWMPYTRTTDKQDFRYQLEIWDGNVRKISKDNISEPQYIVEEALLPNHEYQWQVRPVWTVNGVVEGENWNDKKYLLITPVFFKWGVNPYKIMTPDVQPVVANKPLPIANVEQPKQPDVSSNERVEAALVTNKDIHPKAAVDVRDVSDRLEKLQKLKDRGLITGAEYNTKKREILKGL